MSDLPDRWDDEPWPLDDPIPAPSLNPTNWSDTHDDPPQVSDLADEAWEYALDHGVSVEQALVELQDAAMRPGVTLSFQALDEMVDMPEEVWERAQQIMGQYDVNGGVVWHTTPPTRPVDRYTLDLWKPAVRDPEAHKRIDPGGSS